MTGEARERKAPRRAGRDEPTSGRLTLALTVALVGCLVASGARGQDLAVTRAHLHPVSGPPVRDATVLVRDGRIEAVGPGIPVPEGVRTIDASGRVVTPGLFDVNTRVGLVEVGAVEDTRDYAMDVDDPVRAAFRVTDGFNPNSTLIPVTRLGGVTTVASNPSSGLLAGQSVVVDLAGGTLDAMLVRDGAGMLARFGPDAVAGARGAASLRLREVLEDARFWSENRAAYRRGASRAVAASRLDLAALQPVLSGEMPLVVETHRASDIRAVLRIAEEHGLRVVIQGGAEAWMVADELAAADVPVVLRPLTNSPEDFSRLGARFDNAALLHEAGVQVAISTFDAHNARNLRWEAGNAVRWGLPRAAALRAVTLAPAAILGVADSHGTVEPGKVANLVVWSGDPFELSSRPETVVVRGSVVPRGSRQDELFRRYRSLDEELPPAYRRGGGRRATP